MQGANNQQQAAGQAATMQANQSLNALGQMGGIAGQQAGQQAQAVQGLNTAAQGEQGQILGAIGNQNNANVGMQSNINSANAGLTGSTMQGQQNLMGNIFGAVGPAVGLGGGSAGAKAEGGWIGRYAGGGGVKANGQPSAYAPIAPGTSPFDQAPQQSVAAPTIPQAQAPVAQAPVAQAPTGPQSNVGKHFASQNNPQQAPPLQGMSQVGNVLGQALGAGYNAMFGSGSTTPKQAGGYDSSDITAIQMGAPGTRNPDGTMTNDSMATMMRSNVGMAEGGKVPAMVSPGERYLSPQAVKKVEQGADPIKAGKKVPGKAKVAGAKNDYANDTVPATLEEGGIVLPRSVTQAKNPHWAAHAFVSQLMAKQGKSLPKKPKK
jgi:hypothetical protein